MKVSKICSILDNFINKDETTFSLLIDGKWGCGKTHNVRSFFENNEDNNDEKSKAKKIYNYIYLSLFGIKSANDIVTKLYPKIDSSIIENYDGMLYIRDSINQKTYNNSIIIFDDLERIKNDVTYETIFGVVEALKKNGFKIICITNSEKLNDSINKKEYSLFIEKTFDLVISVEIDGSDFNKIIKHSDLLYDKSYMIIADCNWRFLIKAEKYLSRCEKYMEENKKSEFLGHIDMNINTFYKCILVTVASCYDYLDVKLKIDENDFFIQEFYDSYSEKYGKNIANKFFSILDKNLELKNYLSFFKYIFDFILLSDYSGLIRDYYSSNENDFINDAPFNEEPFYLDDDSKEKYKKLFLEKINEFDFGKDRHYRILNKFIQFFIVDISETKKEMIIKKFVVTITEEKANNFFDYYYIGDTTNEIKEFIDKLKERLNQHESSKDIDELLRLIDKKNYQEITNFLYVNMYTDDNQKRKIAEILKSKKYVLPDLSKTINKEIWEYCHEVAKYIFQVPEYRESFIEILKQQCHKTSSKSVRERCNALVKYSFPYNFDFNTIKSSRSKSKE